MSETKITIPREITHFPVPNGVYLVMPPASRGAGLGNNQPLALGELDDKTLDTLCRTFRDEVFAEAAKQRRNKQDTAPIRGGADGG